MIHSVATQANVASVAIAVAAATAASVELNEARLLFNDACISGLIEFMCIIVSDLDDNSISCCLKVIVVISLCQSSFIPGDHSRRKCSNWD